MQIKIFDCNNRFRSSSNDLISGQMNRSFIPFIFTPIKPAIENTEYAKGKRERERRENEADDEKLENIIFAN